MMGQDGGIDELRQFVVYVAAATTKAPERWNRFAEAVRREVPGGEEVMTDTRGMIEAYAEVVEQEALQKGIRKGREEGRQEGVLHTIEGFLGRNVPWATIEAATGIDEAEFRRLRQSLQRE